MVILMTMMSRSAQAFADVEIARATFPRMDDCNSNADGFTMGGLPIDWVFTTERSTWDVWARHEVSS